VYNYLIIMCEKQQKIGNKFNVNVMQKICKIKNLC
jgi:hypothetical protein